MNTQNQLEHRIAMIKDDLDAIREFILENNLQEIFQKTSTRHCEEAITHLNNIEIACDLKSDESLAWKKFGSSDLVKVYYDDIFISTTHDEPYEIYNGCNYVLVNIDDAEDYAENKIESGEWQAYLIPVMTARKIIYHTGDELAPPPTEIVGLIHDVGRNAHFNEPSQQKEFIYEVGQDLGDDGTQTIAFFPTLEEAQLFSEDYISKHPKVTLFIDTCTYDFLNNQ